MDAIRIENLRSLADTGFIELKPITLLVGENNSGKSTFLRAIPLFRQSVESRTTGPILWYGEFVDFGGFTEAVNRRAKDGEIAFHFRFRLAAGRWRRWYARPLLGPLASQHWLEDLDLTLGLRLQSDPKTETTCAKQCSVTFGDHHVRIDFDPQGLVTALVVNTTDLSDEAGELRTPETSGLVPQLVETEPQRRAILDALTRRLMSEISKHVHANTQSDTIRNLGWSLGIGSSARMLRAMQQSRTGLKTWRQNTRRWTTKSSSFRRMRDLVIAANLRGLLFACDEYVEAFARNSSYVPPLRATAERYYRFQNLAVDEVDFQGRNLAMFLRSLTDTERKRFSEWTNSQFGFSSFARAVAGHISLTIRESDCPDEFNLTDKGFGFSQMLPILTQLWVLSYRGRRRGTVAPSRYLVVPSAVRAVPVAFAVEQPELHLHPRLQARLADSFLDAIRQGRESGLELRLIIETHSSTIVNRLGHRVAKGDIDPGDINVVIFEKASADAPTEIRIGRYGGDGFLSNWPFGFFEPEEVG
jgi:hypothetical protein